MLAQNPTVKTYQPIVYASRLLGRAKKNYTTIKRKALAMVYAINKFRHYLLDNKFVSYVDHMELIHLVNKTQVLGYIAQWLLLFLQFNFTIVYKLGKSPGIADALFQNAAAKPALRIPDVTTNAHFITIQPERYTTTFKKGHFVPTRVMSARKG